MTLRLHKANSFSKTAGLWLRCFLGGALFLVSLGNLWGGLKAHAMTCVTPSRIQVARLRGQVFDPSGTPIPLSVVSVSRAGQAVSNTKSDENGRFDLTVPVADYDIRIESPGFMTLSVSVNVGKDLRTLIHPNSLMLILGLGGTKCGFATTSNKQFRDEVNRFKQRLKE